MAITAADWCRWRAGLKGIKPPTQGTEEAGTYIHTRRVKIWWQSWSGPFSSPIFFSMSSCWIGDEHQRTDWRWPQAERRIHSRRWRRTEDLGRRLHRLGSYAGGRCAGRWVLPCWHSSSMGFLLTHLFLLLFFICQWRSYNLRHSQHWVKSSIMKNYQNTLSLVTRSWSKVHLRPRSVEAKSWIQQKTQKTTVRQKTHTQIKKPNCEPNYLLYPLKCIVYLYSVNHCNTILLFSKQLDWKGIGKSKNAHIFLS